MDFKSLITARKVLDLLWKSADLKGRCWGPNNKSNPYRASNITLAKGRELVSISQGEGGELKIHEFLRTENTSLGQEVRAVFRSSGILVVE